MGRCAKQKRKKKVKRCNSGPGLGPSLCTPSQCKAGMGPEWPHLPAFGIQSPALLRTCPLFPQIPKSENHPRRFLPCICVCLCLCLRLCSFLLVTVTDRACACLCLKRPPPPPPSLQAELPTSSVSTILLTSATSSFCLSSLALLNPLANLRGPLSVNLFFISSTKYSVLARDYQFTPADCPTRQHSRENSVHTPTHSQNVCNQGPPTGSCPRRACPFYQVHWKALHSL